MLLLTITAAAPELLEACKELSEAWNVAQGKTTYQHVAVFDSAVGMAREAIRKAEGVQNDEG